MPKEPNPSVEVLAVSITAPRRTRYAGASLLAAGAFILGIGTANLENAKAIERSTGSRPNDETAIYLLEAAGALAFGAGGLILSMSGAEITVARRSDRSIVFIDEMSSGTTQLSGDVPSQPSSSE